MVEIIYNGDVSPCKIKVKGNVFRWTRGEIQDISPEFVEALLKNPDYKEVKKKEEPKRSRKPVVEDEDEQ